MASKKNYAPSKVVAGLLKFLKPRSKRAVRKNTTFSQFMLSLRKTITGEEKKAGGPKKDGSQN